MNTNNRLTRSDPQSQGAAILLLLFLLSKVDRLKATKARVTTSKRKTKQEKVGTRSRSETEAKKFQ